MKKATFFLAIVLLILSSNSFAGGKKNKGFNGTIKYKITVEGRELTPQEQAGMPTNVVEYYLGDLHRKDIVTPMYSMVTIVNEATKETTILIDYMGKKLYITKSGEEIKALKEKAKKDSTDTKPDVKLLDGTKTIAGYSCKKAKVSSGDNTIEVYYTNDLSIKSDDFEDLPGFPMQYTIDIPQDDELSMVYTASEVIKKKPSKKLFQIPRDYEKMTPEMAKQFGM